MRFSSAGDHDQTSPSYGATPLARSCSTSLPRRTTIFCCMPPMSAASLMRCSRLAMPYIGIFESTPLGDRAEPGRTQALRLLLPVGDRGVGLILPLRQRRRLRRDDDVAARQRAVRIGDHALQQQRAVVPGDFGEDAAVDVGRGDRQHVLPFDGLVARRRRSRRGRGAAARRPYDYLLLLPAGGVADHLTPGRAPAPISARRRRAAPPAASAIQRRWSREPVLEPQQRGRAPARRGPRRA